MNAERLTIPINPMPDSDRLPHALYRAEQVRNLDRCAIAQYGIPGIELMNRAGEVAYRILRERWPDARDLTVLVGVGNNGGDGYVIARLARAEGLAVRLLQLGDPQRVTGDAAISRDAWRDAGGTIEPYRGLPRRSDVLVDALLGTGLERPVEGLWAEAIQALDRQRAPVLAVDIPSGLHADTGRVMGVAVRADVTVSFIGLKQGLFIGAGPEYCGEIRFSALSIPARVYAGEVASARRIDWDQQAARFGRRPRTAHKGTFGHLLVIGGAPGLSGAVRLAGEAALRAGAGLVTIATHPAHSAWLNLSRPELMVSAVETSADLDPLIARADVVAIGPGLGREAWGRDLWESVLGLDLPMVVDADALNLLAESPRSGSDWVLTPHPGEAARLLGTDIAAIEQDRPAAVHALQGRYGGVVVLKGAGTLIRSDPLRPFAVCSDGNPGMATAGSGDVLTGVIGALRAQGLDAEDAACAGVCLHAAAGDRAARMGERGLVAGDIIAALRPVANRVPALQEDS
ncbi:NAD(P)H-hydrate dehydratase [Thiocapsa roseopersicina]|uniref:Bifunctional NAD(P)H-hydrate repair enzyme n=1 Tax=Thiocapsa roseopersicina TaxID=1058 RepID=A0A1H2Z0U4_THIRO|nr:NAD(P)H-hydrate dehydratase [Thiocapsa roseopersicina]SDX11050.1 NAD(P)H-hydrate epimerase [Thiocapsa roseopersicina]